MIALNYLRAGPDYDRAYRAAFANEKITQLRPVSVPTYIVRWEGGILKPYTDRFDSVTWPDHFTMLRCGPTREDRMDAILETVRARATDIPVSRWSIPRLVDEVAPFYSDGDHGNVHGFARNRGATEPVVLLHGLGSAASSLRTWIEHQASSRAVYALDLPGHGGSEAGVLGLQECVERIAGWCEQEGLVTLTVICCDDTAAVGAELVRRHPDLVQRLCLVNPVDIHASSESETSATAARWFPTFDVAADGSHLLKTWYMLRDKQLFWPWYLTDPAHALAGTPEIDATHLTARVLAYWECNLNHEFIDEIVSFDLRQAVADLGDRVEIYFTEGHPYAELCQRMFDSKVAGEIRPLRAEPRSVLSSLLGDPIDDISSKVRACH